MKVCVAPGGGEAVAGGAGVRQPPGRVTLRGGGGEGKQEEAEGELIYDRREGALLQR